MSCHMGISTWNGNHKAYNRGTVRSPRPGPFHSKQAGYAPETEPFNFQVRGLVVQKLLLKSCALSYAAVEGGDQVTRCLYRP